MLVCTLKCVSRAIWSYLNCLELSGAIWSYLEPSGAIWTYLELSGAMWTYLELLSAIWSYLELSGTNLDLSGAARDTLAYRTH